MKITFYLVVNRNGTVKTYKNRPGLSWDEIAIRQNLTLPDALFQKPQLEATVIIPDEAALPTLIDAEVVVNVKEAIEQASGMEVRLSVISAEEK